MPGLANSLVRINICAGSILYCSYYCAKTCLWEQHSTRKNSYVMTVSMRTVTRRIYNRGIGIFSRPWRRFIGGDEGNEVGREKLVQELFLKLVCVHSHTIFTIQYLSLKTHLQLWIFWSIKKHKTYTVQVKLKVHNPMM